MTDVRNFRWICAELFLKLTIDVYMSTQHSEQHIMNSDPSANNNMLLWVIMT